MGGRTFKNKTLVENWYEDRLDTAKVGVDERLLRTGRIGETPIKMENVFDSKDMYTSVNAQTYVPKDPLRPNTDVESINKDNVMLMKENHSIPTSKGYPAELATLESAYTERQFVTTQHAAFGGKYSDNPLPSTSGLTRPTVDPTPFVPRPDPNANKLAEAGVRAGGRPVNLDGGVKSFGSTGERIRVSEDDDPKENTLIQRSWVYNRDGAKFYTTDRPPAYDKKINDKPPAGFLPTFGQMRDITQVNTRANDTIKKDAGVWNEY